MKIYNTDLTIEELEKEMEKEFKTQQNKLDLCELPLCGIKKKETPKKKLGKKNKMSSICYKVKI